MQEYEPLTTEKYYVCDQVILIITTSQHHYTYLSQDADVNAAGAPNDVPGVARLALMKQHRPGVLVLLMTNYARQFSLHHLTVNVNK